MANKIQGSRTYTAMAANMTSYGRRIVNAAAERERLQVECNKIMDSIYRPAVIVFMIELATKRGRLIQLRDLTATGWRPDDIRRIIMNDTYIATRSIMDITGRSMAECKWVWNVPFKDRGRFGNFWQRIRYRIRHWKERRNER